MNQRNETPHRACPGGSRDFALLRLNAIPVLQNPASHRHDVGGVVVERRTKETPKTPPEILRRASSARSPIRSVTQWGKEVATIHDAEIGRHISRNRDLSPSKVRRSKKNCPICLEPLVKNASRTKLQSCCVKCEAHPSASKRCVRCDAAAIWENKTTAACQSCGLTGKKFDVIQQTN